MTINLRIKADVNNLSLTDIYDLLKLYATKRDEVMEYKGHKFKIEVEIRSAIEYTITELP